MKTDRYCDICGAVMKLEKSGKSTKGHRIRRFACTFCDNKDTIWASGEADDKFIPQRGVDEARKLF